MNLVGLFRVSTDRQEERGTSLETQEQRYHEFVEQGHHQSLGTFRGSESATQATKDRRVLQDLLRFVSEKPVDGIWVVEQSRLSRGDELEVAMLMRELRERGIKVVVNGSVRDPASLDDAFMLGVQSLVDRTEALRIKERMTRGRTRRAQEGKKACGPSPFGYRNPPPGHPERGKLQVVPEQAAVVRRVFELAATGMGTRAVANALNEAGMASSEGKRWGKTSVQRVLQNMVYIGAMVSRGWVAERGSRKFRYDPKNGRAIIRENAHEPIVSRELWEAVNGRPKAARTANPRMLTEMLWVNGHPFGGDSSGGRSFYRGPRGKTGLPWLETDLVDRAVWFHFTTLARSEEFVRGLMQARGPQDRDLAEREVEFIVERLGKAKRRLDRLVEMRLNDELTKAEFDAKAATERAAVAALETDLASQRAKVASMNGDHAAQIVRVVQRLLHGQNRFTAAQRRQILRAVVRRVDITAEPVKAAFKRDEQGHVIKGSYPRWKIAHVGFTLALGPEAASTPGTQRGPTWGQGAETSGKRAGNNASCSGQLDTTD